MARLGEYRRFVQVRPDMESLLDQFLTDYGIYHFPQTYYGYRRMYMVCTYEEWLEALKFLHPDNWMFMLRTVYR